MRARFRRSIRVGGGGARHQIHRDHPHSHDNRAGRAPKSRRNQLAVEPSIILMIVGLAHFGFWIPRLPAALPPPPSRAIRSPDLGRRLLFAFTPCSGLFLFSYVNAFGLSPPASRFIRSFPYLRCATHPSGSRSGGSAAGGGTNDVLGCARFLAHPTSLLPPPSLFRSSCLSAVLSSVCNRM